MLDGKHPPAYAQQSPTVASSQPAEVYGLEIRAAVEQTRLDELSSKVADIKAAQDRMWDEMHNNTNAISGMNGQEKGIGGVLIMLQLGSMVFAARKKEKGVTP